MAIEQEIQMGQRIMLKGRRDPGVKREDSLPQQDRENRGQETAV